MLRLASHLKNKNLNFAKGTSLKIIKGIQKSPYILTIYGAPGVGKSTLATLSERPVIIDIEGGVDRIDCDKTPLIENKSEFMDALRWAYEADYQTIVIDSLSALENLLSKKILEDENKTRDIPVESIGDMAVFKYGRGYNMLQGAFLEVLTNLRTIKLKTGKNIILLAHEQVETINNPTAENFDRYSLSLHKKITPKVIEMSDGVFYAHYEKVFTKKDDGSSIAKGTKRRILQTQESPAVAAKSRFHGINQSEDYSTGELAKGIFGRLI